MSSKGMRTQLIPRLTIALKGEAEEEKRKRDEEMVAEDQPSREDSPSAEESDERLDFIATPQILVHPSRTAKGGKFSCSLVSLSVLLDYRPEDTKVYTTWIFN